MQDVVREAPLSNEGKYASSRSGPAPFMLLWPPALLLLISWPLAVASQEASDKQANVMDRLIDCARVQQETLRLQCYDSLLQPLAEAQVERSADSASVIRSFAGSDDHDTDVLTIREPWHLRWALDGSLLSIELRSADGSLVDMVGNQIGAGHGRSAQLEPASTAWRSGRSVIGRWSWSVSRFCCARPGTIVLPRSSIRYRGASPASCPARESGAILVNVSR